MPAVSKKQQRFFGYLLSNPEERKKKGISKKSAKDFAQSVDEAIERQAKDRKKLSQPHSVSGSRRDHSHDVDSALTDHVPRKGKGRVRPASKKEMRVSAMRDAGIKQEEVVDEDFKQFPEKKVSRKIQREKDKLSAGDLAGSKASGSQIQGRQQQLNRKRASRIMKMSRAMNSKTSTSSNERMKMNSRAQKTTRTVDRIKDRQTGSDTYKGRPRRWSLEPKLKDKKKKSGNTNVNESYEIGEASYSEWRKKASDAVKRVAGKKTIKKHEYPGRDAGKEAKQRLSKRDHETVNFLDPDD